MKYCPECGTGHECTAESGAERADVEIMRLQCERDVKVAAIQARAAKDISATEAEHGVAHAEGVLEGVDATLEAMTGGDDDAAEGEPIVVDTGEAADGEPEPDLEPDNAPPVVEVPEPVSAKRGGWWGGYR